MQLNDWQDISYLAKGIRDQRKAYQVLQQLQLFQVLNGYQPTLVGTIPLGIHLENSDLDILCEVYQPGPFQQMVHSHYSHLEGFTAYSTMIRGVPCWIARFQSEFFQIEIFSQPVPIEQQYGYRHFVIEEILLELGGSEARSQIRQYKREGLKTEPAFARYFGLGGDPYEILMEWSWFSIEEIKRKLPTK